MRMVRVILSLALILSASPARAFPGFISYQGRYSSDGVATNGNVSMEFRITNGNAVACAAALGGNLFWTSGVTSVLTSNGLFNYRIGFLTDGTTQDPGFLSIDWNKPATNYYIDVCVDGVSLSPNELLGTAAYALFASSAGAAGSPGNLVLQADSGVSGTGDIRLVTGTSEKLRITNPGSVGVGTSNPAAKLHVSSGAVLIDGNDTNKLVVNSLTAANALLLNNVSVTGTTNLPAWAAYPATNGTNTDLLWNEQPGNSAKADRVTFQAGGNVGIGTTNPTAKLHVGGTAGVDGIRFPDGSLMTSAGIASVGTVSNAGDAMVQGDSGNSGSGVVRLRTGNVDKVLIANNGNVLILSTVAIQGNAFSVGTSTFSIAGSSVGIRTTSPFYALHNAADTFTQGQEIVGGTMTVAGAAFSVAGSGLVLQAGNVGIGTAGPVTALDVVGEATIRGSQTVTSTLTVQGSAFSVNASGLVLTGGNVGIGTASPATTLDIVGGAQFGSGPEKSSFTATGHLIVPYGVTAATAAFSGGITASSGTFTAAGVAEYSLQTSSGIIVPNTAGVYAGFFVGDGAGLTGVTTVADNTKVLKTGDTMTGQLTISGSSLTVRSNAASSPFLISTSATQGNAALFVDASGNLGVGTTSPNTKLHLFGSPGVDGIRFPDGSLMTTAGVGSVGTVSNAGDAMVQGDSGNTGTGVIRLRTGIVDKVFISNSGSVGVGTTSPGAVLEVVGATQDSLRLKAAAGSAGSVNLFPAVATVGGQTGTVACQAVAGAAVCLGYWTSAGGASTCGTSEVSGRALCANFGD